MGTINEDQTNTRLAPDTVDEIKDTRLKKHLNDIIQNNELHARWLNMLSYLEFVGSRKIFKTQKTGILNEEILKHASDEARHALILKQMCLKLGINPDENNKTYESDGLLCGYSAYRYFQSLDSMVKHDLDPKYGKEKDFSYRCYVYVSYIIEVRANWLYAIYSDILKQANSAVSVSGIINDEVRHLDDMEKEIRRVDPNCQARIPALLQKESDYFQRFLDTLERALRNEAAA